MAKKICITGSQGFIGTYLTPFLGESYQVVPFTGDLLDKTQVADFFTANEDVEVVVHLAGRFSGNLQELIDINLTVFANLLEEGIRHNLKKVIYTSTGAVYGEPQGDESLETDPLLPNTPYGLVKKFAEDLLQLFASQNGLDYDILRFPNVYGEGNNKGVVFSFLNAIKEKGVITINGDGEQARNFLHITDACQAIGLAIEYPKSDIFNISNPEVVSINDLVALLKEKYTFEVEYKPANNNLRNLLLNIDKAKNELGFDPKITKVQL